jgi:hypothetical protein
LADKDFKVKAGLDLGTPLPLTEGGTGQTSANNALNAILPVQTSAANKFLQSDGTSTSWVEAAVVNNATFTGSSIVIPSGTTAERPVSPVTGAVRLNTTSGTLEFYTGTAWGSIATFPQPPSSLVATNLGTSRAFNNGSASVAFTASSADGGSTITSYTITSDPGGYTASGGSSPLTITGLQSNTSYTFTGKATNSIGIGASSSPSSAITATTVPQAPTIGTVSITNSTTVSVPFTANASGGSSITSYTVTASPTVSDISTAAGTSSPLTVTGTFAASTGYTFTLIATNSNGSSSASSASNSVIPNPTYALSQTFNNSGTYTVPSGKAKMAAFVLSAGGGGGGGGSSSFSGGTSGYVGGGGGGGGHGKLVYFKDYPVTPGDTYTITIGGQGTGGLGAVGTPYGNVVPGNAGGLTSFGNLLSVNGGNGGVGGGDRGGGGSGAGGTVGTYSSNISGYVVGTNNTGSGGNGAAQDYATAPNNARTGFNGSAGDASSLLVNMNLTGLGAVSSGINTGSSGGGGGGGSGSVNSNSPFGGGSGGNAGTGSGSGGSGGSSWLNGANSGNVGGAASAAGGAGGGGGGAGRQSNNQNGGTGGAGFAGQVVVYIQ